MEMGSKLRLADVFVTINDPRQSGKVEHDLVELLVVAVNAVLVGADTFVEIELWAKEKLDWLRGYLRLENGIPSHDTFGRLFGLINPDEFEAAFRRWAGAIVPALGTDAVVAIDGKTSRRSGKVDATPLHLVSAFAAGAGLVLGQRATAEKSNEKTAIPELLATLALEGCIVTIDAMGTQASSSPMRSPWPKMSGSTDLIPVGHSGSSPMEWTPTPSDVPSRPTCRRDSYISPTTSVSRSGRSSGQRCSRQTGTVSSFSSRSWNSTQTVMGLWDSCARPTQMCLAAAILKSQRFDKKGLPELIGLFLFLKSSFSGKIQTQTGSYIPKYRCCVRRGRCPR